jgi:DNA-3-methyladenine glycosylase II
MARERFEIRPVGPYSFAASVRFLEGFVPAAYEGSEANHLHLAFVVDGFGEGKEQVAGVCVRPEGKMIVGEVFGGVDPDGVCSQVARILSLDVDGGGFPAVGRRDPVVGRLQERYPGLRPVCFYSPYEAAAWALISNRIRITQASQIKAQMAKELGPVVEIHGEREHAFPSPSRLMRLREFPGLSGRKVEYLRHLARKALEENLDASDLRSLPVEEALRRLKELPGMGDFSAELILLRGAGEPDYLPTNEPRLLRAVAMAYGLDRPATTEELREMAEHWRPYRTWVSVYLRTMLEEETHEIAGGAIPGDKGW